MFSGGTFSDVFFNFFSLFLSLLHSLFLSPLLTSSILLFYDAAATSKPCKECEIEKPLHEFNSERLGLFGRKSKCIDCVHASKKGGSVRRGRRRQHAKKIDKGQLKELRARHAARHAAKRDKEFEKVVIPPGTQEQLLTRAEQDALMVTYSEKMPVLVEDLVDKGVWAVAIVTGSHERSTVGATRKTLGDRCNNAPDGIPVGTGDVKEGNKGTEALLRNEELGTWMSQGRITDLNGGLVTARTAMAHAAENFYIYEVGPKSDNPYVAAARERILQQVFMKYLQEHKECGISILWTRAGVGSCTPKWRTLKRIHGHETITNQSTTTEKLAAMAAGGFRFGTRLVGVYGDDFKRNAGWSSTGEKVT